MNRFSRQVLPILMGIAAVLLSVAAIVVIVAQIRGPRNRYEADAAPAALSRAAPALEAFGRGLANGLGSTYLGVSVQAQSGGLLVHAVMPNSPAAHAGIQANDVITAVNGTKVATVDALRKQLDAVGAGKQYTVTVTRSGATRNLTVQQATIGQSARDWFQGALGGQMPRGGGRSGGGAFPDFGGFRRGAPAPTPTAPHA